MDTARQQERLLPLRERRRDATRREIAHCAAALFESKGFQATTVEEIAYAAGLSLRTFYRYCESKETALSPLLTDCISALEEALAARPTEQPFPEAARDALLHACASMDDASRRRLIRVMLAEPALTACLLAANRRAQDQLTPVIAARTGADEDALRPRLLAGLLVNTSATALEYWALHDTAGPLDRVAADAFDAAAGAFTDA
ncbi:TetR/AcrR family transcriptional regulator [Streptomyces ipomoeae]|uniref:TetR/AcrR family transcriptional regulator n=3 Tax=Streptomyces ipomoeae TaxID=103232 RepID=UPI001146B440|nr:TetR family transcriptional regulator [Streptomyces ipomoeae]TQE21196.1 TetR family transcriptional regulator [Streptomyces ipomoeae]